MRLLQQIRLVLAKAVVKVVFLLSKILGLGEGSNFPGKVVLMLFPNLFELLIPRFKNGWILITGTNGKTTTTKILVELLTGSGVKVVTNARGANLITGIVTSILLAKIAPQQEYMADYAVFEIDEAVLNKSFNQIKPNILVVTNFSRDQLDRYGEVDSNVNKIMELVQKASWQCRVILNGNDPNIARIGSIVPATQRIYFGIKAEIASPETGLLVEKDTGTAVGNQAELPQLDLWADQIETHYLNGSQFDLGNGQQTTRINLRLPGVFNVLNALAALAVASIISDDWERLLRILAEVTPSYGRSEAFEYQGKKVFLFLVKNPVGFNYIIQLLAQASGDKRILLLLNDLTADGKDVSWIWDVALENLWRVPGIKEIVTSGTRAGDMALRVKYSDPPAIPLSIDYASHRAFKELSGRLQPEEELMILANYTSMIQFRAFLLKVCR